MHKIDYFKKFESPIKLKLIIKLIKANLFKNNSCSYYIYKFEFGFSLTIPN